MNPLKLAFVLYVLFFCIIVFTLTSEADYQAEQQQLNIYCEMVEIYQNTNGQYGWPAYDGTAQCGGK